MGEGQAFADRLQLRYITEDEAGISRVRRGRGFSYHDPSGTLLQGSDRDRCEDLVVPPAWDDVWICLTADGHLQAKGTDEADRLQYLYHPRWTDGRRRMNFDRLVGIGPRLGPIRRRLDQMLADETDPTRRALAAMVRLVDAGVARIGGRRSARQFGHFGVSTLQADHVDVDGDTIEVAYPGKAGVERHFTIVDAMLADVVADLDDATDRIFRFRDADGVRQLQAADANALLDELTRTAVTCKDFRTWGGSAIALEARVQGASAVEAVDTAAKVLGNSRAVARDSYVHPDVTGAPLEAVEQAWKATRSSSLYDRRERALIKFLDARPPLLDRWLEEGTTTP